MPYNTREKQREFEKKWFEKNKKKRIKQIKDSQKRRAKVNKRILVDEKGGQCSRCGYNKHLSALDFHHQGDKKEAIGKLLSQGYSLTRIRKETKKCIVLCANCHRELHSNAF